MGQSFVSYLFYFFSSFQTPSLFNSVTGESSKRITKTVHFPPQVPTHPPTSLVTFLLVFVLFVYLFLFFELRKILNLRLCQLNGLKRTVSLCTVGLRTYSVSHECTSFGEVYRTTEEKQSDTSFPKLGWFFLQTGNGSRRHSIRNKPTPGTQSV